MDIEAYKQELEAKSILDLMDREVLMEMMRALNYRFRKGAVLLCAERNEENGRWVATEKSVLNPFDDHDTEEGDPYDPMEFFNPFCKNLRDIIGVGECENSDCTLAQQYVDDNSLKPEIRPCWLGLNEPSVPIRINGATRALLMAGGQIIKDDAHIEEIKRTLREQVQERDVKTVEGNRITDRELTQLDQALKEALTRQKKYSEPGKAVLSQVETFSKALQDIIDKLFSVHRQKANRNLMMRLTRELGKGDLGNRDKWWKNAGVLFNEIGDILDVEEMIIYTRAGSRFERAWSSNPNSKVSTRIVTRKIVPHLEENVFTKLNIEHPSHKEILQELKLGVNTVYFERTDHTTTDEHYGTLILLLGQIEDRDIGLGEVFCQEVGLRVSIASLVFQIRKKEEQFRETVLDVSHAIRTPLQAIMFDLQQMVDLPLVREDLDLNQLFEESLDRVFDARTELNILLKQMQSKRNLRVDSLLRQVCNDLNGVAGKKKCWFSDLNQWPENAFISVDRRRMLRVFVNLIENAVKYSYRDRFIGIRLEFGDDGIVVVKISNYGIGIPEEQLKSIREEGKRANVADNTPSKRPRKRRTGMGLGLPSAIRTILEYDGDINITSESALKHRGEHNEPYHDYITTVTVAIPAVRGDT
ncbi:PocR ligand-binding domain-containing protein [Candidatus Babeliales bacterium]|nr:PocR ligand-binding domain-containing protein [Candidatus Babeliales bacterium]